jgi:hypothetical protein
MVVLLGMNVGLVEKWSKVCGEKLVMNVEVKKNKPIH